MTRSTSVDTASAPGVSRFYLEGLRRRAPVLVVMASFLLVLGCRGATREPVKPPKPIAEKRFARFVRALKHDVERTTAMQAAGFRSGQKTLLTIKRTLHEELFPPQNDDDSYTARITIEGTTLFATSRLSSPPDREASKRSQYQRQLELNSKNDSQDSDDEEVDVAKLLGREPEPEPETKESNDDSNRRPTVRHTSDDWTKTFDLKYVDERWELQTEIEDEVLASFFRSALRYQ